jgi:hypothetical protein
MIGLFFRETAFIHVARALFSLPWALDNGFDDLATLRSRILWHLESSIFSCGQAGVRRHFFVLTTRLARLHERWPDSTSLETDPVQ